MIINIKYDFIMKRERLFFLYFLGCGILQRYLLKTNIRSFINAYVNQFLKDNKYWHIEVLARYSENYNVEQKKIEKVHQIKS